MEGDKIAELAINQLIKIILGVLVVVAVGIGVFLIFKNQILEFFEGFSAENTTGIIRALIK